MVMRWIPIRYKKERIEDSKLELRKIGRNLFSVEDVGDLEDRAINSRTVVTNSENRCEASSKKQGRETFTIG